MTQRLEVLLLLGLVVGCRPSFDPRTLVAQSLSDVGALSEFKANSDRHFVTSQGLERWRCSAQSSSLRLSVSVGDCESDSLARRRLVVGGHPPAGQWPAGDFSGGTVGDSAAHSPGSGNQQSATLIFCQGRRFIEIIADSPPGHENAGPETRRMVNALGRSISEKLRQIDYASH